jgi:hypothetical protein
MVGLLSANQQAVVLRCPVYDVLYHSVAGVPAGQLVPQQLLRRGRVPAQFEANATLIAEGATYSWLYQQIFNLLGWAPCPLSNSASEHIHAI